MLSERLIKAAHEAYTWINATKEVPELRVLDELEIAIIEAKQALLSQLQPEEKVIEKIKILISKDREDYYSNRSGCTQIIPQTLNEIAEQLYRQVAPALIQKGREETRAYTEDIIEVASNAQGEYLPVDKTYSPFWTHGYKNVIELANQSLKGGTE